MRSEQEVMEILKDELDSFETNGTGIKEFTKQILCYMPDYFLQKEKDVDNKIVIHTKSCMVIANELFKLESFRDKFQASERDCIRSALLLHDAMLYGSGEKQEKVHEHPEYISMYIQSDKWEKLLPAFLRKEIAGMLASHEGQWNKNGEESLHLPKPQTECEIFVHMCVHLVSVQCCTTMLPVVLKSYNDLYEENQVLRKKLSSSSAKQVTNNFSNPYN